MDPFMHITNSTHPITHGLPQDWFWGTTDPIGPLLHVEDPEATALGQVIYSLGRCKPGFAAKSFAGKVVARRAASFRVELPRAPTALYFTGKESLLAGLRSPGS